MCVMESFDILKDGIPRQQTRFYFLGHVCLHTNACIYKNMTGNHLTYLFAFDIDWYCFKFSSSFSYFDLEMINLYVSKSAFFLYLYISKSFVSMNERLQTWNHPVTLYFFMVQWRKLKLFSIYSYEWALHCTLNPLYFIV